MQLITCRGPVILRNTVAFVAEPEGGNWGDREGEVGERADKGGGDAVWFSLAATDETGKLPPVTAARPPAPNWDKGSHATP